LIFKPLKVLIDRPGMFSPKDRAKWDAWNSEKGIFIKMMNESKGINRQGQGNC